MNTKEIKALLDRYFEAETSLEEEKTLRQYFANGDVEEDLKPYASMFGYFAQEAAITTEKDFLKGLNNQNKPLASGSTKVISIRRWVQMAAAASAIFLASFLVIKYMIPQEESTNLSQTTAANYVEVQDPEEAIEYTEDAIRILAQVFKTSEKQLESGMERIDNTPVIGAQ